MIGEDDAAYTYEYDDYYKILPAINDWHLDKQRIQEEEKLMKGSHTLQKIMKIG